jgi:hypothetical protein
VLFRFAFSLGAALVLAAIGSSAHGQAYPSRTIRLIVPYSAGSGADIYYAPSQEFGEFIKAEITRFGENLKQSGTKLP